MKWRILIVFFALILSSCSSKEKDRKEKGEIFYTYGTQKLLEKDYTGAIELLLKAYQNTPKDSNVNNNLGMAYYFKGRLQQAMDHINQAISLDSNNMEAYNNLASILLEQKKYDLAEKQYNLILENIYYRKQYRTYYNLGIIKLAQNKLSEATSFFQKSITESPNYCPPYFQLGQIEEKQLKFAQALKSYTEGTLGACYNFPATHYQMGLVFQKLGKPLRAQDKFQEILTKFPNSNYSALAETQLAKLTTKDYSGSQMGKLEQETTETNSTVELSRNLVEDELPNPAL